MLFWALIDLQWENERKHSIKTSFHVSLPLTYDTNRYFYKWVSIAGTTSQQTSSLDTKLHKCAVPGNCSDQHVGQVQSSEVYYLLSAQNQMPHHLPHWLDRKFTKAKQLSTIMLYKSKQHLLEIILVCAQPLDSTILRTNYQATKWFLAFASAQLFVRSFLADLLKAQVSSPHFSCQAWPELPKNYFSTHKHNGNKIRDWANMFSVHCQIYNKE